MLKYEARFDYKIVNSVAGLETCCCDGHRTSPVTLLRPFNPLEDFSHVHTPLIAEELLHRLLHPLERSICASL